MRSEVTSHDMSRARVLDLSAELERFASSCEGDGLVHVFLPHATAGLAIVETGSGTEDDLLDSLERLLPRDDRYRHSHGSRGHGGDHVVPAYVAPSATIPIVGGCPALGTWQSLVLVDTNVDNPRRSVRWSFIPA